MRNLFVVLFIALFIPSCDKPDQSPEFKGVSDVRISKIDGTNAVLKGDAYFHNPNNVKMKLRKVEVDVTLDGKRIGVIRQELKTLIPPVADFKVPVNATFNIKESGVLNNVLSLLGGKKMKVNYSGFIKLTVYGVPVRVPVDYTSEIRL